MVICHCRAVNDQTIRATIIAGASEPDEVLRKCGAGARCGGCLPALLDLLDELQSRRDGELHGALAPCDVAS